MSKGRVFPAESSTFADPRTGVKVRQVTSRPCIHHHPFYYVPCMDDAMRSLVFVSHRTGRPEIWCEIRASGELQQLTEQEQLNEWSLHPSHDGRFVYYTAGQGAWRVSTETANAEQRVDFRALAGPKPGMVGAATGTTAVSHDDRYWALSVRTGGVSHLVVVETETGRQEVILEREGKIEHLEFHPSDSTLLRYAGAHNERVRVINRDGSGDRLVYERKPHGDGKHFEWIVHETWNPRAREIITANWPRGCIGIDVDTGAVRTVCSFNAWHPAINRRGNLMCADTTFPDIGLQLFDPTDGIGEPRALCLPQSSNVGAHWDTPYCPYDDEDYQQGKWKPHAPQHTHPHPSFSPDGTKVVFTSDRTGHAQVYEVNIPLHA